MEEAVKQSPVVQEKLPQVLINGEDAMPVGDIDEFKGHRCSAPHGVQVAAGRAEAAVAAERDEFQLSAAWAAIHCPAESGIATVNHLLHVFNDRITWMQCINHFFIMVSENIL